MEVDEDADCRTKLEIRKQEIAKDIRNLEGFKNMDETIKKFQKENWQKVLALIEQRRYELLPEHDKLQKLSQKLQKFGGRQIGGGADKHKQA